MENKEGIVFEVGGFVEVVVAVKDVVMGNNEGIVFEVGEFVEVVVAVEDVVMENNKEIVFEFGGFVEVGVAVEEVAVVVELGVEAVEDKYVSSSHQNPLSTGSNYTSTRIHQKRNPHHRSHD